MVHEHLQTHHLGRCRHPPLYAGHQAAVTDSAENWRKAIWPAYKSNRSAPKPLALLPIRDLLTKREDVCLRPGLEADDVIGILATRWSFLDEWDHNVVIWSVDKDLLTIPGKHADIKNPGSIFRVTSKEADYQWWLQTLTGDTSDGYPGLPGFGPVKAKKWLDTHGASWASVREAFIQHGSNEEEARIQATMARILRAEDYDFTKKEVRPWKPPLIPDTPTRETTT